MAKGILYVETHALPDEAEAYHKWYDETHLAETIENIPGIVSARRYSPLKEGDPFVAIYDIEADDVAKVRDAMFAWMKSGTGSTPSGVDASKPFVIRFFELRTTYP